MNDRDREAVLDALADGISVRAVAQHFNLPQNEVREVLKEEAERAYDGAELRQEWAMAARRLKKMELAFHQKALDELCPAAAVIALKANERRAALQGGSAAQAPHLLMTITAKAVEEAPTSTQRLAGVLKQLRESDPNRQEREAFEQAWAAHRRPKPTLIEQDPEPAESPEP